ncbi:glycosyltransferase family 4 protein [Thalassotalea ganghwensis]
MLQVMPYQQKLIGLRVMGKHHLPDQNIAITFWQTVRLCRKPLSNGQYRIFHARRVDEMIQGLMLKHIFRAKIKLIFSSAAQRYRAGFTKWLTDRMDAVLAMCKASASYLHRAPDAIIYHGIKVDQYQSADNKKDKFNQLGFPGDKGIAILGRVRKQKGVHLFVRACIELLDRYPGYTAVVVGSISSSNQEFVEQLKSEVAKANLSERIIFTGEQPFEKIPEIFSSLSVVAALSENEGFGLTILEAMSAKAAVLATEAGAWPEVIRQGVDGYVVPVNDQQQVTEKLEMLLKDGEKLAQMGEEGSARVKALYNVEREAQELVNFYRKLQTQ